MKVFVTGAAGFIGQSLTADLIAHGHTVLGLARSDANADKLKSLGAEVHRGDLKDLESLKAGAAQCDGTVHLAFNHDFTDFVASMQTDRDAVEAMGSVLEGTGKPFVIASGTLMTPKIPGKISDEDTRPETNDSPLTQRAKTSLYIEELSKKGVRGSVVRLSPITHAKGGWGLIPGFVKAGEQNGYLTLVGDGSNKWPSVHRDDAAILFRLALEKGRAGAAYNAVAEQGVTLKEILDAVGEKTRLPVQSKSVEEGVQSVGFLAYMLGADNQTSSEKTQKELGWTPKHIGLLQDIRENYP